MGTLRFDYACCARSPLRVNQEKLLTMFKSLSTLISGIPGNNNEKSNIIARSPPDEIIAECIEAFRLAELMQIINGLPVPDWDKFHDWYKRIEEPNKENKAWGECEIGWLLHLRDALGANYSLRNEGEILILSSIDENVLKATFDFIARTNRHIPKLLNGIAASPERGYDIMIVFDDEETYYNYVSRYDSEPGEYAYSGGMFINQGCGHFVTIKQDLTAMEPTIAHELTHAALSDLDLPLWLDEGITVNTEHRLARAGRPRFTPQEMHEKHLSFWGETEIQEFWSGHSFSRPDDGNLLSYDLARILVAHFLADWDKFREFVLSANTDDSGASAALAHLGVSLGASAASLFDKEGQDWEPALE